MLYEPAIVFIVMHCALYANIMGPNAITLFFKIWLIKACALI